MGILLIDLNSALSAAEGRMHNQRKRTIARPLWAHQAVRSQRLRRRDVGKQNISAQTTQHHYNSKSISVFKKVLRIHQTLILFSHLPVWDLSGAPPQPRCCSPCPVPPVHSPRPQEWTRPLHSVEFLRLLQGVPPRMLSSPVFTSVSLGAHASSGATRL